MPKLRGRSIGAWAGDEVFLRSFLKYDCSLLFVEYSLAEAMRFGDSVMSSVAQIVDFIVFSWARVQIFYIIRNILN